MFSETDKTQITAHGLVEETLYQQIENFKNGFSPSELVEAALPTTGIRRLSMDEVKNSIRDYDAFSSQKKIVKFVPASGAATRMFKDLYSFRQAYDGSPQAYAHLIANQNEGSVYDFFKRLEFFAFYPELAEKFKTNGITLPEAHLKRDYKAIVECLLDESGLGYGSLPKGLISFHRYADGTVRTPVQEHMEEGCQYARSGSGEVNIHFTVSPEHRDNFEAHVATVAGKFEAKYGISLHVTYSEQKPSTDTIAVDLSNEPYRHPDGSLLFRPAGHGALLANLNEVDADIIFLKN
ncbi:MAG: DUF4301 family protein, partial [Cyclobacteriaceae bacterium]|nr:DUF4301 family protein [Cyclobacteriaceae bacterium]